MNLIIYKEYREQHHSEISEPWNTLYNQCYKEANALISTNLETRFLSTRFAFVFHFGHLQFYLCTFSTESKDTSNSTEDEMWLDFSLRPYFQSKEMTTTNKQCNTLNETIWYAKSDITTLLIFTVFLLTCGKSRKW